MVLLIAPEPLRAETVPYRALAKDHQVCLSSFGGPVPLKDAYCMCTVIQLFSRLDHAEYVAMEQEALTGESNDSSAEGGEPSWMRPILEISAYCQAQVTKE